MTEQPVTCLRCTDGNHPACIYNVTVWKHGYMTIHVCQCALDGHTAQARVDLESVIETIMDDEDMLGYMATKADEAHMRALLHKHLEPVWKQR